MKYREYLTPEEQRDFDAIVAEQDELRAQLRDLRTEYLQLFWLGRDRSKRRDTATK